MMKAVLDHLAKREATFAEHPFFVRLERSEPFDRAIAFAPGLTFWVMTFQDVLRINESRVKDPDLKKIARHHRVEDSGHEKWFLDDVVELEGADRDLRWLYSKFHMQTRDASYAIMSEVFRASDDRLRIVLLLTLESAGHIFFDRIVKYIEATGYNGPLRYFAASHLKLEKDHALFEQRLHETFENELLSAAMRSEAIALVDRVFDAFTDMFDGLEVRIVRHASGNFSIRPPVQLARTGASRG